MGHVIDSLAIKPRMSFYIINSMILAWSYTLFHASEHHGYIFIILPGLQLEHVIDKLSSFPIFGNFGNQTHIFVAQILAIKILRIQVSAKLTGSMANFDLSHHLHLCMVHYTNSANSAVFLHLLVC